MANLVREIKENLSFSKKFTFCTLMTRLDEYLEMVESAKKIGFDTDDVEFLYFDNSNSNLFDGYCGFNRAVKEAQGEYLIICHQDLLFKYDTRATLEKVLNELNQIDSHWAVAGNAGRTNLGKHVVRITDPHGESINEGPFPQKVISVDENFFVVNQKMNLSTTYGLNGFHLYGLDICQNAIHLGLNCYVIDFHLFHKSGGNPDKSYSDLQKQYMNVEMKRKQGQWFFPMCSVFYICSSPFLNWLLNVKRIRKLLGKKH